MLELGLKSLIAYLLGSVLGSLVMGRLRGVDIREQGSGNAGGTNALRTQGWSFALGVVLIDVGKALLAVGVLPGLALPGVGFDPAVNAGGWPWPAPRRWWSGTFIRCGTSSAAARAPRR